MNANWQQAACERPDPYLDWEYRTRSPHQTENLGEPWCSVQVRVLPDCGGSYLPSLCQLRDAVESGRQDDDIGSEIYTIRMVDEERANLAKRIDHIAGGGSVKDNVEIQFFIYRLEPLIYYQGKYRNTGFYKIISAWPPIRGLKFNGRNEEPDPIIFPRALTPTAVAVGIIDDGIAFAHERFRSGPQASRFHAIWLQEVEQRRQPDNGVLFGFRLNHKAINRLLKSCKSEDEIYRHIGLTDFGHKEYNPLASRASHGTHVLDLASGRQIRRRDRPILAVQLPSVATIDTSGVTMGSYVLQAVRMIMTWADKLDGGHPVPLVINFSYGLQAGPKDGTQQLEQALADLINYRNNKGGRSRTYLVFPAGNSYRARAAARMELKKSVPRSLDWVVLPDDGTPNFLEIWLDGGGCEGGPSPVEITLTPPGEDSGTLYRLEEGVMRVLTVNNRPIAGMYYHVFSGSNGMRERILLAVGPSGRNDQGWNLAPSGRWKVTIGNVIERALTAHFYIQRDDTPFGYSRRGRQAYLDHDKAYERDCKTGDYRKHGPDCPIIYEETLSAIATSPIAAKNSTIVVVGAAEATDHCPPADYTSSGPTISRNGPDCSAIADHGDAHLGVLAAGTFSGSVVAMRGTSVAAPQIVRQIADELAGMTTGSTILVPPRDEVRLGKYVFIPAPNRKIPRRRYPAIDPKGQGC